MKCKDKNRRKKSRETKKNEKKQERQLRKMQRREEKFFNELIGYLEESNKPYVVLE